MVSQGLFPNCILSSMQYRKVPRINSGNKVSLHTQLIFLTWKLQHNPSAISALVEFGGYRGVLGSSLQHRLKSFGYSVHKRWADNDLRGASQSMMITCHQSRNKESTLTVLAMLWRKGVGALLKWRDNDSTFRMLLWMLRTSFWSSW